MNVRRLMEPAGLVAEDGPVLEGIITEWQEGLVTEWKNGALIVRLLEPQDPYSQFGPVVATWTVWNEIRDQLRSRVSTFVVDVSALDDLPIGLAVLLGMISREMEQVGGTLKIVNRRDRQHAVSLDASDFCLRTLGKDIDG